MVDVLPIDALLPRAVAMARDRGALVLVAEAGAGKTTRFPPALLEQVPAGGDVVVVEPRRLAARLAARRVAAERGEPTGELVGYRVRFEDATGPRTRLLYVTDGVMLGRLLADRRLTGVGAVVVDEVHERRLDSDLVLALAERLRRTTRPDLVVVATSATVEAESVARFLDCEVLRVAGRVHPVELVHLERPDPRPLAEQVAAALRRLVREGLAGDVLVFLPGAAEIRRARETCASVAEASGLGLALLHGELPASEQDRAVARGDRPKVILSTNVAESSVTIEGVVAVVDSGLARVPVHSPWTGLSRLDTVPISRASAAQRAGRAGRLRPGRCLRLYTRADHDGRPEHDAPEVRRADLAAATLALRAAGLGPIEDLRLLESPPAAAIAAAERLLVRLGAVEADGRPSGAGRAMASLPCHPRLARLCLEARARGVGRRGALLAALLEERDVRLAARTIFERAGRALEGSGPSDLLDRLESFEAVEREGLGPDRVRAHGLDPVATRTVARARDRIVRALGPEEPATPADEDEALGLAALAAFGDRVAKRRSPRGDEVVFAAGGSARLSPRSVVREAPLLVAVEAEQTAGGRALVTTASAIEPEWLAELFPERLVEARTVVFDRSAERVLERTTLAYDGLVLESSTAPADPAEEETTASLARAAIEAGPVAFCDRDALERLRARVAFARGQGAALPELDPERVRTTLAELCAGRTSFAELRQAGLLAALRARLGPAGGAQLDRIAPAEVSIPGRRRVPVLYERDRPPHIESRVQDFFGALDGPAVGGGTVPLVLHLLAPNGRALQVTTDLAGFWQRHYPALRKELARRYPRHLWPDNPARAEPPRPGRRRG